MWASPPGRERSPRRGTHRWWPRGALAQPRPGDFLISLTNTTLAAHTPIVTTPESGIGYIVFHYPAQGGMSDLTRRVEAAVTALRLTDGCLTANSWTTIDKDAVVATGTWRSAADLEASFAECRERGVDFQFDERERQPRQTITLHPTRPLR